MMAYGYKRYELFLQIAEYENISKAAEELHISQPPLSRQLRKLEEELGVELFTRDNGRLQLTEAGHFSGRGRRRSYRWWTRPEARWRRGTMEPEAR